ncbi:serine/threonine-protein kinase [Meiothermus granaticius]|uniref:serine/threonine-protein kinase n=1 Tax=Meiothermus granaticius TaxID=863370 RepID=UPI0011977FAA|nr:serine/threonine-protein kinase [Meiothermus granaticius]GEM87485.1 serine/threonine protein kinase [Meiothermus granaticius NBRC 107808]
MVSVKLAGRYRLDAPLGEGGMAEVWRALDERMDRQVAVKLLHTYIHPTERSRFFQEVKALSKLSHPGVVQVYDLGEEAGRTYFVMELVEGGSLERLGPFEEGMEGVRLLEAAIKVLEALEHLHTRGVIHRDLTPRNILVAADGQPKVMDFGLAYLMQESRHFTRTGYTLGTPEYMAPEQARGLPLTPQADLYSFGAVLYRTFTGKPLFEGENDQSVLYQHVYEMPKPAQGLNPALPAEVSGLVTALVAKTPSERPLGAASAKAVLEEHLCEYRETLSGIPRAGASRSGHYPTGPARPERLELQGTYDLGGEVAWPGELVARDGSVWVGAGAGVARLELLDPAGGTVYRQRLGDEVSAPPVVTANRVYAAAWDGRLTAISRSGRPILSFPTRAELTAAPLVGETIYLPGRDGFLYALDPSGGLRWGFQAGGHLAASPTLYRGLLFIASEDGWLYALDPERGGLRYKVETGPVHTAIPARGGRLFIPTWDGELHAFDPLKREVQWSYDLEGELWGAPAVDEARVYAAGWTGWLYALDVRTGDEVWKLEVGKVTGALSLAHGMLYLGTEEGRVLALEASTGRVAFEATGLGPIQAPPLPYRGALHVATLAGKLYRFA